MSKYTFKIETEDLDEFQSIVNHSDYQALVFQLKNNFHRNFKNLDHKSSDFNDGVHHVLDALREEIHKNLE